MDKFLHVRAVTSRAQTRRLQITLLAARLLVLLAVVVGALAVPWLASAQAGDTQYFISNIDTSAFPMVKFRMRAVDLSNKVVTNLNSTNVAVYESDGSNTPKPLDVEIAPKTDGPVAIIFMVDQGRDANFSSFGLANVRQIFTLLTTSAFQDNKDTVMVLNRININSDQTQTLVPANQSGAALENWASIFPFTRSSGGKTQALQGILEAVTQMSTIVPTPGTQAAHIILITRYIEDPANDTALTLANNYAETLKQKFISVDVFHLDPNKTRSQPLLVLAESTSGIYAPLQKNSFSSSVNDVYSYINSQRHYYDVVYTSTLGTPDQRQIFINTPQNQLTCKDAPTSCFEVKVEAPIVQISNDDKEVLRTVRQEDGEAFFLPNTVTVTADIAWPDGHPRTAVAEIFQGDSEDAMASVEINPEDTKFSIPFNISEFSDPGTSEKVEARVVVEDAVGLIAEDSIQFTIKNPALEPTPTPTPKPLIDLGGDSGNNLGLWLAIGVAVVFGLVVIAAAVVFFVSRGRQPAPAAAPVAAAPAAARGAAAPAMGGGAGLPAGDVQNTLIAGPAYQEQILAKLTVLVGPKNMIGEPLSIVKPTTVLGRNPQKADIIFYSDEESSVSRVHCTIQLDGSEFKITDNGSRSGTRVNGWQLKPNDPMPLGNDAEIVMGDLGKNGIKLKFNIVSDPNDLKAAGDRTFIYNVEPSYDAGGGANLDDDSKWSED